MNAPNTLAISKEMPHFISETLNAETTRIFNAVNAFNVTATETRKTVASTLARIESNKSYKDDGFKSLAEYAERIGLDKSLAHKMENAGRMLNSENPVIRDFADKADYSKLAILSSADQESVVKAIEDGDISADSTQAEVKQWKASNVAEKAKVLVNYEVDLKNVAGKEWIHYDSIALEAIPELDGYIKVGNVKTESEKQTAVYINLPVMNTIIVQYKKAPKPKKAKTFNTGKMSKKALQAELARLTALLEKADEEEGYQEDSE